MSQPEGDRIPTYDLVGLGFGPSNLALAIALRERNAQRSPEEELRARFFERQPHFGWHRNMLIDDATMQVSFLKDLVTMRNPASEFSFLSYLNSQGRLVDFINQKSLFPLRIEFHDYLEWAAHAFDHMVHYGQEVTEVRTVGDGGSDDHLEVLVRSCTGEPEVVCRAANVVFGVGMQPRLPEGLCQSERVWHNRDLLSRAETIAEAAPTRFAVAGAGQSAAEVTKYLHDRFPHAEVHAVFSRYGYSPSDDSPFANRIFDPEAVDHYFAAPEEVKRKILDYHGNTNYSVVDPELIEELYRRRYQEKVLGSERLVFHNVSRLAEVVENDDGVRVTVESLTTQDKTILDCDVLVCATGYRALDPLRWFTEFESVFCTDDNGDLRVRRDYRAMTVRDPGWGIYLQGGTEHTHGISSSLLSNTVARSGDILRSIEQRKQGGDTVPSPRRPALARGHSTNGEE